MRIAFSLLVFSSLAGSALAGQSHMKLLGQTSQPIGHAYFCQQLPEECRVISRNTKPFKLTAQRWAELQEVNAFTNEAIEPATDQQHYGVEEHWTYPKDVGDCEDYALLKRYLLMQRGWPASSLLMTVVKQANGDGHAVLTVRTDKADFVLDNLVSRIDVWNKTPYTYIKRVSERHSGRWVDVNDIRRTLTAKIKLRGVGKAKLRLNKIAGIDKAG